MAEHGVGVPDVDAEQHGQLPSDGCRVASAVGGGRARCPGSATSGSARRPRGSPRRSRRTRGRRVQGQPAGRLQLGPAADRGHHLAQLGRGHVVAEQEGRRRPSTASTRLGRPWSPRPATGTSGNAARTRRYAAATPPAASLWLSLTMRRRRTGPSACWRRRRPAPRTSPAPAGPGVVLRVSSTVAFGAGERVRPGPGVGGHAGHPAEQVQRGALGGEQRPGRAGHRGQHVAAADPVAVAARAGSNATAPPAGQRRRRPRPRPARPPPRRPGRPGRPSPAWSAGMVATDGDVHAAGPPRSSASAAAHDPARPSSGSRPAAAGSSRPLWTRSIRSSRLPAPRSAPPSAPMRGAAGGRASVVVGRPGSPPASGSRGSPRAGVAAATSAVATVSRLVASQAVRPRRGPRCRPSARQRRPRCRPASRRCAARRRRGSSPRCSGSRGPAGSTTQPGSRAGRHRVGLRRQVRAADVGGDPAGEDQPLQQRVGGQPVGAVHAGAGDLAAGVQAGDRGAAAQVGADAAARRSGRPARPGSARSTGSMPAARQDASDGREPALPAAPAEVRGRRGRRGRRRSASMHPVDALGHHVARGQLGQLVLADHEPLAVARRPGSAPSPRTASQTSGCCAARRRRPAARSAVGWNWTNSRSVTAAPARSASATPSPVETDRVGGGREDLAHAAGGEHHRAGQHRADAVLGALAEHVQGDPARPGRRRSRSRSSTSACSTSRIHGSRRDRLVQGPLHLGAGGVAAGVHDPVGVVAALAGQHQRAVRVAVELGAPADQLADPGRALARPAPDRGRVAQPDPGDQGVARRARPGVSSGSSTAAMPPCAHRVEPSSMLTLVTTVTCRPASRRCSAAGQPGDAGADHDHVGGLRPAGLGRGQVPGQARDGHAGPSVSGTLSISRVAPTRAATSSRAGPPAGGAARGRRRAGRGSRRRSRAAPRSARLEHGAGAAPARCLGAGRAAPGTAPAPRCRCSGVKVAVAAGQRQPVRLPYGRARRRSGPPSPGRPPSADQGELLVVLLAEERRRRAGSGRAA